MSSFLRRHLGRLWALDTFPYSLRIFIALSTSMAVCWVNDQMALVMPLFLGTIASALAETDDNWRGRLRALLVTLLCFAAAAFAVQSLFPHPWAFFFGMVLATFSLTMMGAISPRYQAIAYGTLILSIYTTIGMDQRGGSGNGSRVRRTPWLRAARSTSTISRTLETTVGSTSRGPAPESSVAEIIPNASRTNNRTLLAVWAAIAASSPPVRIVRIAAVRPNRPTSSRPHSP